jgi:hypothetical protein
MTDNSVNTGAISSPPATEGVPTLPAAGPGRCEGCGAPVDETSSRCAYCGTPHPVVAQLEAETRALLALLETRLEEAVQQRTDVILIIIFFLFVLSGPACYMALGLYTEGGMLIKIAAAIVTALCGFTAFGWQCVAREEQAEHIAWRDVIADEIARFIASKDLSTTEFIAIAQRLLNEGSRLRKVMLKWIPS